jgi:hypothetical protein
MDTRNIKQHVTFVGALHIGFGILGLISALVIYILFNFASTFVEYEPVAITVLNLLGRGIPILIVFFSSFGIIGGIGLFSYAAWARILVLIISAINCLNIPIGTAKGIYSIWVLMQKETIDLFEENRK